MVQRDRQISAIGPGHRQVQLPSGLAGDQLDILTDSSDSTGNLGSDWGLDDMHLVVRQDGQVVADEKTGWPR
ncbi:hypothetical protein [Myceligenerans xiligouense]|uniref:hypothetical protein n=1 Tax=Myceligenerans xiligouense TaxID=253184 RepID=UPI001B863BA2|nr:hypothetical protein [Myceligenerans xiligouense]